MKKKILIAIGIIAILIVVIIAFMAVSDMIQEKKLMEEFQYVEGLTEKEDHETDEIKEALERVITKGDYGKVETSYKQYLKDVYGNMENISKILDDEKITNSLTSENYKEDGPDFVTTKKYLTETKQSLEEGKNKYYELLTEDGAMKYIKEQNLDSYYEDLYKNEIKVYINQEERDDKTVEESINDVISVLSTSEKIINFLSENKGKWEIEEDSIVFETQKLSDEYDKLTSEI